jgi:hypothetical protein
MRFLDLWPNSESGPTAECPEFAAWSLDAAGSRERPESERRSNLWADPVAAVSGCGIGEPVLLLRLFVCIVRTWRSRKQSMLPPNSRRIQQIQRSTKRPVSHNPYPVNNYCDRGKEAFVSLITFFRSSNFKSGISTRFPVALFKSDVRIACGGV